MIQLWISRGRNTRHPPSRHGRAPPDNARESEHPIQSVSRLGLSGNGYEKWESDFAGTCTLRAARVIYHTATPWAFDCDRVRSPPWLSNSAGKQAGLAH